ncbi:DUF1642 domain-containing protein [Streptococcus suis]|uniref:DUF1642 domain-containing protein n=1 Tax=Streptococcus suis TaxID=1307 RepID=UPI0025B1BD19|nr:DUF1642 domain-containing protein [Streptococcus suis]MDN2969557.1 DUF1642 domain-containing protein [Streptococcus suis]MDN2976328.1 DUF1642 domain-containing protein [Streptococcus suis]HEM5420464.1 DUF1642 domain-containing protein [Streptococcus suis]
MNTQEAIEIIEHDKIQVGRLVETNSGAHSIQQKVKLVDYVPLEIVVNSINQINEPRKVVVPKHIADKIEYCKDTEGYGLFHAMDYCYQYKDSADWLECNEETFARAWIDGYEVEQEKLYMVELFNGQPLVEVNNVLYFSSDLAASNVHVSKDKLESAGFGWVFECDGVEFVEV